MDKKLIAVFEEHGFVLDFEGRADASTHDLQVYKRFSENPYKALFLFGFKPVCDVTAGIKFLHELSEKMIDKISHKADIEFTRENTVFEFSDDELSNLLLSVPFATGVEYVNKFWLIETFNHLGAVFKRFIAKYNGTVQEFLAEQKSDLTVMGRVFFHLVENKNDEMPFAFLATYSAQSENKKVNHVPLKNALLEYKDQTDKLLELLSTVSRVVQKSTLISGLVESGELFSPLRFSVDEAYTFLKELPLYEEAGIICRIPDWWKKNQNRIGVNIHLGEKGKSRVGEKAILSFDPQISLGDENLTEDEIADSLRFYGEWCQSLFVC